MEIDVKQEIKCKIGAKGLSLTEATHLMNKVLSDENKTTPQYLNNKLTRGSLKYSEAMILAESLGQKIVWVDKE